MTVKIVYQTDHLGVYVGPVEADPSPREEGVYLIPQGCVEVQPPAATENRAPRWNGKAWDLVECYRGLIAYNVKTGEPVEIDRTGPLPNGYTFSVPGPHQVWKNGQWVDDVPAVLVRMHQERTDEVNAGCSATITGGFGSEALGAFHTYSSDMDDQLNLTGAVVRNQPMPYACRDSEGVKAFRLHTVEQLHLVGEDFTAFKLQQLQHANDLKQQLDKALADQDLDAMQAIRWGAAAP